MSKQINDLKEELRQEIKAAREAVERDLRADMRELRSDVRESEKSLTHMNDVFEELRKDCNEVKAENAALREENDALRAEIDAIKKRLADTELRLTHSEQYSRNKNIEIKGLDEKPGEDVTQIVCDLGALAGVEVAPDDIEACHRVPSRNKPSCIVVQFNQRQKRDSLLEKARKLRLKNSDFDSTSESPVFVNEHLCPTLKRLLGIAAAKKRSCGWKYVWCRNGKIFAKKSDDSDVLTIKQEHDLEKIV